ncbi:MAG: ATP-dependent zinc metalloprotease FtsH [Phycisphaeraceae bacterium]|nr:ATP-dependent zinc metalloprotease FtsH [Phycisphaeraceae bacterium]
MSEPNNDESRQDRPNRQGPGGGKGPGQRGSQPFMSRSAMWWLLLGVLAVVLLVLMNNATNPARAVSPIEFLNYAQADKFSSVVLEDDQMIGTLKSDSTSRSQPKAVEKVSAAISPTTKAEYVKKLMDLGVKYTEKSGGSLLLPFIISWGPMVILGILVYFLFFRSLRGSGGGPGGMLGNFGRSRHKVTNKEHSNVTLADVAGIEEAKEEVSEVVEFLKNPKKFQRLGGRVPRGILLIGDPGCGKTLLAKAVAGEAEVPFFSISGSDFVEMFVGVGASRVRDLFKQAKDSSPCIIFLDEIDAVGRKRGSGSFSGGHDEREQTLNAILVEMDGFDTNDQVIVMAATNRSDVLDPALTRPGRFDRQIHVPLPDIRGRMDILKVHSRRIKMGPDVNLEKLARGTPMFSGADLAAIINEAAISATLLNKDFVEQEDLEEARDKVKWGRSRKSHKIDEIEKKVIAYHEAGHALVMYHDPDSEPLHKVTIIPRGQALGVTFMLPEKDKHIWTKRQLMSQLRVTFGGRIAEEMFCGDISSGAAMDIRQASHIARAMITQYGMSEKLGFLLYGMDESRNPWEQPEKLYSDETAKAIDEEVKNLIDRAYHETRQLLETNRAQLERLAEALLRYETLNRDDVDRLMKGEQLAKPTVGDLLKAEQNKSRPSGKPTSSQNSTLDGDNPSVMPTPA